MTKITITKGNGRMIIDVDGHADYAPHGQDIVCAGISAIIQSSAVGLQAIAETYPDYVTFEVKRDA